MIIVLVYELVRVVKYTKTRILKEKRHKIEIYYSELWETQPIWRPHATKGSTTMRC